MTMDRTGLETPPLRLCDFLRSRQNEIISDWTQRMRALSPARELADSAIIDHLPQILRLIAEVVASVHSGRQVALGDLPRNMPLIGSGEDSISTKSSRNMVCFAVPFWICGNHKNTAASRSPVRAICSVRNATPLTRRGPIADSRCRVSRLHGRDVTEFVKGSAADKGTVIDEATDHVPNAPIVNHGRWIPEPHSSSQPVASPIRAASVASAACGASRRRRSVDIAITSALCSAHWRS